MYDTQVRVANHRTVTLQTGETQVYVGRSRAHEARNPLGNPFPVTGKGRWTRDTDEACALLVRHHPDMQAQVDAARRAGGWAHGEAAAIYLPYLRACYAARNDVAAALDRLALDLRSGKRLVLVCWCAPRPCHADAIRQAITALAAR